MEEQYEGMSGGNEDDWVDVSEADEDDWVDMSEADEDDWVDMSEGEEQNCSDSEYSVLSQNDNDHYSIDLEATTSGDSESSDPEDSDLRQDDKDHISIDVVAITSDDSEGSESEVASSEQKDDYDPLDNGKDYMVRRGDGQWYPGEIIAKRVTENPKNKYEYFVHYEGYDRRLDEWVIRKRVMSSKFVVEDKGRSQYPVPTTVAAPSPSTPAGSTPAGLGSSKTKTMTRSQKRLFDAMNDVQQGIEEMDPANAALEKEHEDNAKIKYIDKIQLGKYEIDTWYFSPYPEEYGKVSKLWVCQYCLKYMRLKATYCRHLATCLRRQPPGREIYRKGLISVYEVDGDKQRLYCQCLCLLSKLFLDHKTLYFDVQDFLFYIFCRIDMDGAHIIGYFSKEKFSAYKNNVSCILTLPHCQRKGYGKFMISFSYELSKIENTVGSPEKPLSDLGMAAYRSYWSCVLLKILSDSRKAPLIKELSKITSIAEADIVSTLQTFSMVKYWKGVNVICVTQKLAGKHLQKLETKKSQLTVDTTCIRWGPQKKTWKRK